MKLLITFCNNSENHCAVLDLETKKLQLKKCGCVPSRGLSEIGGLTGITFADGLYFMGVQSTDLRGDFVCLNEQFEELYSVKLRDVMDVHALSSLGNNVYLVSTGTNSISGFNFVRGEFPFWTKLYGNEDRYHLNSFCFHMGRPIISMFGERGPDMSWKEILSGIIRNPFIEEDVVVSKVSHPHSLLSIGNTLWYCESYFGDLCSDNGARYHIGGYTRGLAWHANKFYVGMSFGRGFSRSTRKEISEPINTEKKCGIAILSDGGALLDFIDLSEYSSEIYALYVCKQRVVE